MIVFDSRYKCLCPDTWPRFSGSAKDGVGALVSYLNYDEDDYRMGKYVPRVLVNYNFQLAC